ncbi:hypothetical protein WME73_02565 [Sorangium sp. So ce302]|uniref:hypothetical protein n=1 Tax=Sorangium sp. So ce302 TaxID=3133297 RepID=UPI003F60064A
MPVFQESGLIVSLPDGASFRFADCPTYRTLSGRSLKEMDFGYWDDQRRRMVLLEVKDYSDRSPKDEHLLETMVAKGRDSLLMLNAAWQRRGAGRALVEEIPGVFREEVPVRLYFILKVRQSEFASLRHLRDPIRTKVLVYAELLGLNANVQFLDHQKAMTIGLPVAEVSDAGSSGS